MCGLVTFMVDTAAAQAKYSECATEHRAELRIHHALSVGMKNRKGEEEKKLQEHINIHNS